MSFRPLNRFNVHSGKHMPSARIRQLDQITYSNRFSQGLIFRRRARVETVCCSIGEFARDEKPHGVECDRRWPKNSRPIEFDRSHYLARTFVNTMPAFRRRIRCQ